MGQRRGGAAGALIAVMLVCAACVASGKKPKRTWKPIESTDELVTAQNEVLLEAAGLGRRGDFVAAGKLLRDFTGRVMNLDKSGGLGANLLNTMGEYFKVGKDLDAAQEAFQGAVGAIKGYQESVGEDDADGLAKTRRYVDAAELHRARTNIAKLMMEQGDKEEAEDELKALLREAAVPEYKAMAAKELGVHHLRFDELEIAKAYLEFAVELHPTIPKGHSNLALVLHKIGDLDEAEEAFLEAIKLDPDAANSYANLGTLYAQTGETVDAENYLKLALQKDPNHRDAAKKLEALREMAAEEGDGGIPKFRSPMKKVGGERREKVKMEL